MTITPVAIIEPNRIVDAFGSYRIGITLSKKGEGHLDDGHFRDVSTDWSMDPAPVLQATYLRQLTQECYRRGSNFIEFWGWPEIRYRDDDTKGMVYSRVRFLFVIVEMNTAGRPN